MNAAQLKEEEFLKFMYQEACRMCGPWSVAAYAALRDLAKFYVRVWRSWS